MTIKLENNLILVLFPLLLGVSNALWGSTIGIISYLWEFYGIDPESQRATYPDAIYYLFYLICSIPCFFFNRMILSLCISLVITLIGILLRLNFYIPVAAEGSGENGSESGSELWNAILVSFSGFNGTLAANAFIAAAQPFMFGFTTMVTDECVLEKYKASYIGFTTMASSFGYAFGYLFSIHKIQSVEEFKTNFHTVTVVYLVVVLILFAMMFLFFILRHRRLRATRTVINLATTVSGDNIDKATVDAMNAFIKENGGDDKDQLIDIDILSNFGSRTLRERYQSKQSTTPNANATANVGESKQTDTSTSTSSNNNENGSSRFNLSKLAQAKIVVITYSFIVSLSYVVGNYLTIILQTKNFSANGQLIGSSLFLMPGILFPPLVGLIIDYTGKLKLTVATIILVQVLSQTMFLFSSSDAAIYFALTVNSIATTCATPGLLTLVHKLVFPMRDKNYNNFMYSFSIFSTLVIMLIPIGQDNYTKLYIALTILSFLTFFFHIAFVGCSERSSNRSSTTSSTIAASTAVTDLHDAFEV